MRDKTTWEIELKDALREHNESWDDIESSTLSMEELTLSFDPGYGVTEGCPFTVWTKNTVYFPLCYEGAEWVGSISRHPNGKPTEHQGGGW
jgi:hypothetical protein